MLSRTPFYHDIKTQIDTILVPQGMEHQAVCRGINQTQATLQIYPIPMGIKPLTNYLKEWQQTQEFLNKLPTGILVMGLGGSLSPRYGLGEAVLYRDCCQIQEERWETCDANLSELVSGYLGNKITWGRGMTSDRLICLAEEKRQLGTSYQTDVVDMEGMAVLDWCKPLGIPVAMMRVISDNCQQDLPNLTPALQEDGTLHPWILGSQMLKQPLSSFHLIRSSLQGLKRLQQLTQDLFAENRLP